MEENDKILSNNSADVILLIDTNTYLDMNKIAEITGYHVLNFLKRYPHIDYYFSFGMIKEILANPKGLDPNIGNMGQRALNEETFYLSSEAIKIKSSEVLYNSIDGRIKQISLNNISATDHAEILLCQNHPQLLLVTTDKKMMKTAAPLLDRRLTDLQGLLEFLALTPNKYHQVLWSDLLRVYLNYSGYKRPTMFRVIPDRKKGPRHATLDLFVD